ncbi:MAG: response regulator [Cyclobacteriaceae bacterium]|nr:response regulator [Cyclobacteriaceae bacterium]
MSDRKPFQVLVIDDDKDILDLLEYNLEKEGFNVKVLSNSQDAIVVANDFLPDLIILDIMMPHPNGIELCRELRSIKRFAETYIFFLTAKSESYYQQAALDTGGDDFIEKVVGLRALTYKIKSVLKKRFIIRKGVLELRIGNMIINRKSSSVTKGGQEIVLSRPEFELLFFFAQNPHKTITMDNLLRNIWGSEIYMVDTSIDVYIQNLKAKLGLNLIHRTNDHRYRLETD